VEKINRLVIFIATGLLFGEIFGKFNIEIFWGFILVPIIIPVCIKSRNEKAEICLVLLLFLISLFLGKTLYVDKCDLLKSYDLMSDGEIVEFTGEVVNIWITKDEVKVEVEATNDGVRALCYFEEFPYKLGSKVVIRGEKNTIKEATNFGEFDLKKYYNSKEIFICISKCNIVDKEEAYSEIKQVFFEIRQGLKKSISSLCDKEEAGILCAMLFGDKEFLEDDIKNLYTISGIGHILAISGLHISLAGGAVYRFLRRFMRQGAAFTISSIMMICFCCISGESTSTVRAVIMYIIGIFAKVIGRKYDIKNAMAVSMIWILLENPLSISNGGFILSFVSVFGIAYILPMINEICGDYTKLKGKKGMELFKAKVINSFVSSTVLYFVTLMCMSALYYEVYVYSIIANALLLPMMGVLVICGFLGGVVYYICVPFGKVFISLSVILLNIYEFVCGIVSKFPKNIWVTGHKSLLEIIIYYVVLCITAIICVFMKRKNKRPQDIIGIMIAGLIFLVALVYVKPKYEFNITFVDVGQGDCIYIESPDGKNYIIDGGSSSESSIGEYKIAPYLKYRGRDNIDVMFVTHPDVDHISGLIEIIEGNEVGIDSIVFGKVKLEDNKNYKELCQLAKSEDILISYISEGDIVGTDLLMFRCISPLEAQKYEDINASSIVLLGEYKDFSFILTGDIGESEEQSVMVGAYKYAIRDIDLLKVAHHGSKNSSCEEFVEWVDAKMAVISCGEGNLYGHPSPSVVDRFQKKGTKLHLTMESGMICVNEIEGKIIVESYGK